MFNLFDYIVGKPREPYYDFKEKLEKAEAPAKVETVKCPCQYLYENLEQCKGRAPYTPYGLQLCSDHRKVVYNEEIIVQKIRRDFLNYQEKKKQRELRKQEWKRLEAEYGKD